MYASLKEIVSLCNPFCVRDGTYNSVRGLKLDMADVVRHLFSVCLLNNLKQKQGFTEREHRAELWLAIFLGFKGAEVNAWYDDGCKEFFQKHPNLDRKGINSYIRNCGLGFYHGCLKRKLLKC